MASLQLHPGDAVTFPSDQQHRFRGVTGGTASFLYVEWWYGEANVARARPRALWKMKGAALRPFCVGCEYTRPVHHDDVFSAHSKMSFLGPFEREGLYGGVDHRYKGGVSWVETNDKLMRS